MVRLDYLNKMGKYTDSYPHLKDSIKNEETEEIHFWFEEGGQHQGLIPVVSYQRMPEDAIQSYRIRACTHQARFTHL